MNVRKRQDMNVVKSTRIELPEIHSPDFQAALAYWRVIQDSHLAPSWSSFSLMDLPPRIIPSCVVVDAHADPLDFTYRFWGTALTPIHCADYTGKSVRSVLPAELGQKILAGCCEVLERKEPMAEEIEFTRANGMSGCETVLRLPFSDDNLSINKILTLTDYTQTGNLRCPDAEFSSGSLSDMSRYMSVNLPSAADSTWVTARRNVRQ